MNDASCKKRIILNGLYTMSYIIIYFFFQNSITFNILEYYEHGDTDEAAMALSELNIVSKWHLVSVIFFNNKEICL